MLSVSVGARSRCTRQQQSTSKTKPLGKLAKDLRQRIEEVKNAIVREQAAEAVAARGPQKGGPFEQLVYPTLQRTAKVFGGTVEDVSGQNRD